MSDNAATTIAPTLQGQAISYDSALPQRSNSTAICFHGETRTLNFTAFSLRRHVINHLGSLRGAAPQVFAATGRRLRKRDDGSPYKSIKDIQAEVDLLAPLALSDVYDDPILPTTSPSLERYALENMAPGRTKQLVQEWYGWQRCGELIEQYEKARGQKFELVMRIRFDVMPFGPLLDAETMRQMLESPNFNMAVFVPSEENYGVMEHHKKMYSGINDRVVLGGRSGMFAVFGVLPAIQSDHWKIRTEYTSEAAYTLHLSLNGVSIDRFLFPYCLLNYYPDEGIPFCKYPTEVFNSAIQLILSLCIFSHTHQSRQTVCRGDPQLTYVFWLLTALTCNMDVDDDMFEDKSMLLPKAETLMALSFSNCDSESCTVTPGRAKRLYSILMLLSQKLTLFEQRGKHLEFKRIEIRDHTSMLSTMGIKQYMLLVKIAKQQKRSKAVEELEDGEIIPGISKLSQRDIAQRLLELDPADVESISKDVWWKFDHDVKQYLGADEELLLGVCSKEKVPPDQAMLFDMYEKMTLEMDETQKMLRQQLGDGG